MNDQKHILLLSLSLYFLLILSSCKTPEKVKKVKWQNYTGKQLMTKMKEHEFKFNSFSSKASITFNNGEEKSFKAHLRIKQDSLIWISITPVLGIEMARVLITKDTVKVMDRVHSEYFSGNFEYVNTFLNTELDYQMLEALLLGNSMDFEYNNKIRTAIDRKQQLYYISTEKKRKVKIELKKEKLKLKKQAQVLWLEPFHLKIKKLLLKSTQNTQSLTAFYDNYVALENELLPHGLSFKIVAKTPINVDIKYTKPSLNKSLSFPFKIPSKYERIQRD